MNKTISHLDDAVKHFQLVTDQWPLFGRPSWQRGSFAWPHFKGYMEIHFQYIGPTSSQSSCIASAGPPRSCLSCLSIDLVLQHGSYRCLHSRICAAMLQATALLLTSQIYYTLIALQKNWKPQPQDFLTCFRTSATTSASQVDLRLPTHNEATGSSRYEAPSVTYPPLHFLMLLTIICSAL